MKQIILIALLASLGQFVAAECPALTGTFFCKADAPNLPDSYNTITRTQTGAFWSYTIAFNPVTGPDAQTQTYVSDGVLRHYLEKGGYKGPNGTQDRNLEFTASMTCGDDTMLISGWTTVPGYGTLTYKEEYSLAPNGNLAGHSESSGGTDERGECVRQ
jgi:hypothetical protein